MTTNNLEKVLRFLERIYKVWDLPLISQFKSLFAWIGLLTGIYLLFFFLSIRPTEVGQIKEKEKQYQQDLSNNEVEIENLGRENEKLFKENDELEKELQKIQSDYQKQKKKYEKQISYLNNLSNKQLSRLFSESFKEE